MIFSTKTLRRICDLLEPLAHEVKLTFITEFIEDEEEPDNPDVICNLIPQAFNEAGEEISAEVFTDIHMIKISAIIEVEEEGAHATVEPIFYHTPEEMDDESL